MDNLGFLILFYFLLPHYLNCTSLLPVLSTFATKRHLPLESPLFWTHGVTHLQIPFFIICLLDILLLFLQPKIAQGCNKMGLIWSQLIEYGLTLGKSFLFLVFFSFLSRLVVTFLKISIQRWMRHVAFSQGLQNRLGEVDV